MRIGLTKQQKTTKIFFNETKSRIIVYTHNTRLEEVAVRLCRSVP